MEANKGKSELRFFSLGIVANNKAMSEKKIQVTPIESLTMLDGEIASLPTDVESEGTDADGKSYNTKVTSDTAVEADWLQFSGSNRLTAPDVRRGELVMIWQYGDTDDYRWSCLDDRKLRKLETAIFSISATQVEGDDGTLPENSYSVEMSSHLGLIQIRTSKANGEYCIYIVQINAKEGRFIITDELGNEVDIDSKNTVITIANADGSKIELNKQKILALAPDSITLEAANSILCKTTDFTVKASNTLIDSGQTVVNGPTRFTGAVTFDQEIQANGMRSSAPVHGPSETLD